MKRRDRILAAVGIVMLPLAAARAQASAPDAMYIFGDSFSDIGAGYLASDGPTALADLAEDLKIPLAIPQDPDSLGKGIDFAVSGAPTGSSPASRMGRAILGLGMKNQVEEFARRARSGQILFSPSTTLFILAGGLNDGRYPTQTTIGNLEDEIRTLAELGAIHIQVALLPEKIAAFHDTSARLNPAIKRIPAELAAELPNADIRLSNWGPYFDQVMGEPARYGITDTTTKCAGMEIFGEDPTPCKEESTHFFYLQSHPSAAAHRIVGDKLYIDLLAQGWGAPEHDPVAMALSPFWRTGRQSETILPIQEGPGKLPHAALLFHPLRVMQAASADGKTIYRPGTDYLVDNASGVVTLPQGSRIPFRTRAQLELTAQQSTKLFGADSKVISPGIFFSEGAVYQGFQTNIEYSYGPSEWKGPIPEYAGKDLPATVALLKAAQPIHLLVVGDSISAGASASGYLGAPPRSPAYPALVAAGLQRAFGAPVFLKNAAVGGWRASQGAEQAADGRLTETQPDLVIVAFGMNDVGLRDPDAYGRQIASIVHSFRDRSPKTEFILVASMMGNAQWANTPADQFPRYLQELKALAGPGIHVADMTDVWRAMLERKTFFDLTGNGLNHPNDFAQRIYAQVILASLYSGPASRGAKPAGSR